jgi:F-type H+-transporting ATPase subunit delta
VTSATKAPSAVATRYAVALMDLAEEGKKLDKVVKDLDDLRSMIADSPDLSHVIRSPLINKEQQKKALFALADKAKLQDLTKNFLGVLADNGRLAYLEAVIAAFHVETDKRRGAITVDVQVAQDMSAAQKKALQDAISKSIGTDVTVNARVEPSILGGMIVTVGSYMIDDSVARKLQRLQVAMSKQSNENLVNIKEAK